MKGEIVEALVKAGCIKFGKFKLSSGRESHVYVDLRTLYSRPEELRVVIGELARLVENLGAEYVCGVETSGIPLASIIAYELGKPMIYVRKRPKEHGTSRLIEGAPESGHTAVVVDDVSTTGSSLARAVVALRSAGMVVEDAVVVVDRQENCLKRLSELGVRLHSLVTLKELLGSLRSSKVGDRG